MRQAENMIALTRQFVKKLKTQKLSDVPALINLLSNFDMDIYLNFNPDRCLFREQFLRLEEKKASESDLGNPKNERAFDEDAMLGQVLVKEKEKNLLKQKEEKYLQEVKSRRKTQKDMTTEEVKVMFMFHGVILDTFIKAVKVNTITKSSFIGTLVRLSENINRHLVSEGGFFSMVINLRFGKHAVFYFDEAESVFKCNYYNSPLLNLMDDPSIQYNKQYLVRDLLECSNQDETKVAFECYKTLLDMSKDCLNNSFKWTKPESSIWVMHFLKMKNLKFKEDELNNMIKSVTFMSVHQMLTLKDTGSAQKSFSKNSAELAVPIAKSDNQVELNGLAAQSQGGITEEVLRELHKNQPNVKSYENVYNQVSVFLNYITNFTDLMQLINERTTLPSFNTKFFHKMNEAYHSLEREK